MKKPRKIREEIVVQDEDASLVTYYPNWLPFKKSRELFNSLKSLPLKQETIVIPGRGVVKQPRLTGWYGDPNRSYTYSGLTLEPQPWTTELLHLKDELVNFVKVGFNSVLVNYYRDGHDSIGKHSDDERDLGPSKDDIVIASVSFNGPRAFILQNKKTGVSHRIELQCGSLLLMRGRTQQHWTHEIAKTKAYVPERLNLTYRVVL